jgi:hypothetical protein
MVDGARHVHWQRQEPNNLGSLQTKQSALTPGAAQGCCVAWLMVHAMDTGSA